MTKKTLIGGLIAIVVLGAIGWSLTHRSSSTSKAGSGSAPQVDRGVKGDPLDVTLDFYSAWLNARRATSTDPIATGLLGSPALSQTLADKLAESQDAIAKGNVNPVLCQSDVPEKIRTKSIFTKDDSAQIMVLPTGTTDGGNQATVTLAAHDGLWEITNITCGAGEQAPDQGQYSFDREGQLLHKVPPPLDPKYWYLVFTENGTPGHTVQLLLDQNSTCVAEDGSESVCSTDMFSDAMYAHVQGDMTEGGLQVKRISFAQKSN